MWLTNKQQYALILILVGLLVILLFGMSRATPFGLLSQSVRQVHTTEKVVALTFDDGPSEPYTSEILDVLEQYDAKATFFVIGNKLNAEPDIFQRIVQQGHDIGNHSWNHARFKSQSVSFLSEQIVSTDRAIRGLGYAGPIHFRAPYGDNPLRLRYLLQRMKRPQILWSLSTNDWQEIPASVILQNLDKEIAPGAIILLHDGVPSVTDAGTPRVTSVSREETVEVTRRILEKYIPQGYRFVTVSELFSLSQ